MEVLIHHAEKVQQMYEAFNRGDIPFIMSVIHDDCIWEVMGQPEIPFAGIYHGPRDIQSFFEKLNDQVEITEMIPEHHFESGNLVVTTGRWSAIVRKTKKIVSTPFVMLHDFNDDGKLTHFRDVYDTLAAAKAFGN